jgi:hypothetical protein
MQLKNNARFCAAGAMLLAAQACWAYDGGAWSIGTGFNYSSGNYGTTTDTEITSIPISAAYDTGPWTLKLTVPYVRITGASDVVVGLGRARRGRAPATATTSVVRTTSGLGDVVAAATYNFYNNSAAQMGADVTGKVKFGTADKDKGLGTGENDYVLLLDVYKKIGQWTVFGGVGYTDLGSSPDIPLRDVFNASAGTTFKINDMSNAGMAYDYRQRSSATGFAQSELTAFYIRKFDKAWKGQAYLLKGFSDGSPDWGGGVSVGYAF